MVKKSDVIIDTEDGSYTLHTRNAPYTGAKLHPVYGRPKLMPDTDGGTFYVTWRDPYYTFYYKEYNDKKQKSADISKCIDKVTVCWDYKVNGVWFDGANNDVEYNSTLNRSNSYDPPENATAIRCRLKMTSKKFKKTKDKEVKFFTGGYGKWKKLGINNAMNDPDDPEAPNYQVDYSTNKLLVYMVHRDEVSNYMEFKLAEDKVFNDKEEAGSYVTQKAKISNTGYVAYEGWTLRPGHVYRLAARAWKDSSASSEWSEWSAVFEPGPESLADFTAKANSPTSILTSWANIGANVTEWKEIHSPVTYTLEMIAEDKDLYDKTLSEVTNLDFALRSGSLKSEEVGQTSEYVNNSDIVSSTRSYLLQGLDTGQRYFLRLRPKNEYGPAATYTAIHEVILGCKPSAPTAWSESNTITDGSDPIFYWNHNSVDGSAERKSKLEYSINNGAVTSTEIANPKDSNGEWKTETRSYTLFGEYSDGTTIKWRVATSGVFEEYSDFSDWQEIKIYTQPSVVMTGATGSFPMSITGTLTPTTQTAKDMAIQIYANETHYVIDQNADLKKVDAGELIFSKTSNSLSMDINAFDLPFGSEAAYTIKMLVNTTAGLTAETSATFTTGARTFSENNAINASVELHPESLSADITTEDIADKLAKTHRIDVDGRHVTVDGTDKYTPLRDAVYRAIYFAVDGSSVEYKDLGPYSFGEADWSKATWANNQLHRPQDVVLGAFIQWGEDNWLSLLYNLDISPSYKISSTAVEYDGRTDPVTYYNSMQSQTDSWSFDVLKEDRDTLNKLRQLALYAGDVYVREPRGIGYWAHVEVSFSETHANPIVPVSLTITRSNGE